MEVHANLLPTSLLLQNACHQATMRLATLPDTHPLYLPIRKAARQYISSHRSSLHCLTQRFDILPESMETLRPACRPPSSKNPWTTHIAINKDLTIEEHEQLTDLIQVYSDGSGYKGRIRAAAILFRAGKRPRTLWYHLGTEEEHTVFEAEEVGLMLAAHLIATEPDPTFPISISVDNQASIQSSKSFHTRPGSYLADHFHKIMKGITRDNGDFKVTIHWVPGHAEVHRNEEADKQAKLAAEDR